MDKYQCSTCGYIYDPTLGDPDGAICAGTGFKDVPYSWHCPLCGADKDFFELL